MNKRLEGKRGKNYDRRKSERWRMFARAVLQAYKAAGHEIADRPVLLLKNGNPTHPSLEAALAWAYGERDKRMAIREAAENLAAAVGDSAGNGDAVVSTEAPIPITAAPNTTTLALATAGDSGQPQKLRGANSKAIILDEAPYLPACD